jgi:hypothetical protein
MYDVVKNDPNYMKHTYKANAHAIQAIMNEQSEFKSYQANSLDDEDDSEQD